MKALCTLLGVAALASCVSQKVPPMPHLATAEVTVDYFQSNFRRVGILPFAGQNLLLSHAGKL